MHSNLMINGGEAAKVNVMEHENSILANLVPGRVEVMGFKCIENKLNTFNISVSVSCPMLPSQA